MPKAQMVFRFSLRGITLTAVLLLASCAFYRKPALQPFDAQRAYNDVLYQVSLGPRIPGSAAHQDVTRWIDQELVNAGWSVSIQETEQNGIPIRNIIGSQGKSGKWIILGAHYDTRQFADRDPEETRQASPVPGANDGASGVAVLLELARSLPELSEKQIWLVFFDAEDQGNIAGQDWILGSQFFVQNLKSLPDAAIIIDMIGDKDLNIYFEKNSNTGLAESIWSSAAALGFETYFIPEYKYQILDDHLPFIKIGVPAIDIIDFDYPYWHTTGDTPDKVSPESLKIIGETLTHWLNNWK